MENNQNLDLNIKYSEACIKSTSRFVDTKYTNICTGETYIVPTGSYEYVIGIPVTIFILGIVCCIIGMYRIIKD